MANPKKSDVRQHETFPGTGPNGGRSGHANDGASGLHPVEQMVDAAIDRLAREYQAARVVQTHALAVRTPMHGAAGRLRWKGIDVTDEFREYAERVAQGEDLPPYVGKILAEPHPSFPWEPAAQRKASRRARGLQAVLWLSALTIAGLIVWSVALKFSAPQPSASAPPSPTQPGSPRELVPAQRRPTLAKAAATPELEPELFAPGALGTEHTPAAPGTVELGTDAPRAAAAAAAASAPAFTGASGQPAPARRAQPLRTPPRPITYSAPSAGTMTPAPDSPPAGSLSDALGALLAARGAPGDLPTGTPPAPVQPGTASAAAAPVESANAEPVGKEPRDTASGKGSMLLETPSF